jgi:hypothetical protein
MPSARRFTLIDAMVFVATTALGLGLTKGYYQDLIFFLEHNHHHPWEFPPGIAVSATLRGIAATLPCGLAWTLGVLALRLRRPRPRWRRLARQPGLVACLMAPLPVGTKLVDRAVTCILDYHTNVIIPSRLSSPPFIKHGGISIGLPPDELPVFWPQVFASAPIFIVPCMGMTVTVAWIVLAMGGRFRPERSWVDRLGRVLGVYWIAVAALIGTLSEFARYLE